jgi:hypothetical protein
MSGLAIPTYVVDSPHGGGKIPLMPNYLVSASDDAVILRNYEGMLVRYQAEDKPNTIRDTVSRGVSALLIGSKTALVPENTERMARRRKNLRLAKENPTRDGSALASHTGSQRNGCPDTHPRMEELLSLPVIATER